MRLSDIPEEKLEEIRKFIQENVKNYPVTSSPGGIQSAKTLTELIKERFGVELSPSQVYELKRGYKTVRVKLTVDTIKQLEEEYGSVEKGLKDLARTAENLKVSAYLKPALKALVDLTDKQGSVSYTEAIKTIADLKYSDPDNVLKELFRQGFGTNVGGKYKFTLVAVPWYVKFMGMM